MRPLTGATLLSIWEYGQGRHPVDQALAILAGAFPEVTPATLAALSIGQRDARLLEVYQHTFGPRLEALVHCPQCQEQLELALRVADLHLPPAALCPDETATLQAEGYTLRLRLPTSVDLGAVARLPDVLTARAVLLQRCVLEATYKAHPVGVGHLPATVVTALAAHLAACDPQAEVRLNLTCPACAHGWQALFDIVTFLWARIRAQAAALLRQVHTLACAYGWHEADILALSEVRRQCYLEMLA